MAERSVSSPVALWFVGFALALVPLLLLSDGIKAGDLTKGVLGLIAGGVLWGISGRTAGQLASFLFGSACGVAAFSGLTLMGVLLAPLASR